MRIDALSVIDFPPFSRFRMEFPAKKAESNLGEVHILTGQNGTGKTRLLSVLAAALGNTGDLDSRTKGTKPMVGVTAKANKWTLAWVSTGHSASSEAQSINLNSLLKGSLISGVQHLGGPLGGNRNQRRQFGMDQFAAMAFRGVAQIGDAEVTALNPIKIENEATLLAFDKTSEENKQVAQSLVNIKMGAAMEKLNDDATAPSRASMLSDRLENAVSQITGRRFRFSVTPYPKVNLKASWGETSMRFNQLPDGLRCVIGWLAACVAKLDALFPEHENPLSLPLILLLDEPEGHLHPAWQRKLLPAAQALFPNGQFFVATHSPFVISSVNEGWIHVLRADENAVVSPESPRECSKGDSYVEVVEEILGVKEWFDPETERQLAAFRKLKDTVLNGEWEREAELRESARSIGARSDPLNDMIAGEMRQFERLKKQSRTEAA